MHRIINKIAVAITNNFHFSFDEKKLINRRDAEIIAIGSIDIMYSGVNNNDISATQFL